MNQLGVIVIGVLIIVLPIMALSLLRSSGKPDERYRDLARDAAILLTNLQITENLDKMNILNENTKQEIGKWMSQYRKVRDRG